MQRNRFQELPEAVKNNRFTDFLSLLIESMVKENLLILPLIKLEGYVVATGLYFVTNNKVLKYMQSWNPSYAKLALGTVLDLKMIEYAIRMNILVFDFGRGSESYKLDYCNAENVLYNILIKRKNGKDITF